MKLIDAFLTFLFPPKCVLCRSLLSRDETDLCRTCRTELAEFSSGRKLTFVKEWTVLWHYDGHVRSSLLRYKFSNARSYSEFYGRMIAMRLLREDISFDILTWVPISAQRRWKRGYDQVQLIAEAVGRELNTKPCRTLKKIRNNPAQSTITGQAQRKANVMGVYKAVSPETIAGKRVLLLDDIVTTGSTVSECARVLLTAGAKEVICAAVAASSHQESK